jgi:hypothetical protein
MDSVVKMALLPLVALQHTWFYQSWQAGFIYEVIKRQHQKGVGSSKITSLKCTESIYP